MRLGICTAFALAATIVAAPVRAGVILDTFGPGNTFDNSFGGYTVSGADLSAVRFTLGTSGILDDIAVAAQALNFSLVVVADNIGEPGGSVLGTVSSSFTADGYIEFDPSIALAAGTYWLLMSAPSNLLDGWYPNDGFLEGPFKQSNSNGADWTFGGDIANLPAVRIGYTEADLVAMPSPGALPLFAAGLLGLAAARRGTGRTT